MFTLPMAEMQPHGIGDAQCAPKERKDRKVSKASKVRNFILAFLSCGSTVFNLRIFVKSEYCSLLRAGFFIY
jgi:hypothetical protein